MSEKEHATSWEFIYAEWQKGTSVEQLSKVFGVDAKAITRHASQYKWKDIKGPVDTKSMVEVKKGLIEKSRNVAINNCIKLEEIVADCLKELAATTTKAGDLKAQQNKASTLYTIVKVVDIVADVRARAVGDIQGKKEEATKNATTILNVLLPKIMAKPRTEMTQADVTEIHIAPTRMPAFITAKAEPAPIEITPISEDPTE